MKFALVLALACLFAAPVAAKTHHHQNQHHRQHVNPLKGSRQAMANQNQMADKEHLVRLNEKELADYKKRAILTRIPTNKMLTVDSGLPERYRYVRPEVATALLNLASRHYAIWHKPLRITSAVRTTEYQEELRKTNGNAARADSGPGRSSHLTGATVDITKIVMSAKEIKWMRPQLSALEQHGRAEVTEEFHQAVFHIMFYKTVLADSHHKHRTHHGPPHKAVHFL